jgi:hypothetical protein
MAYRTTKNTGTVSMSAAAVLQSAEGLNLRIKKRKTRRQTPREREREGEEHRKFFRRCSSRAMEIVFPILIEYRD